MKRLALLVWLFHAAGAVHGQFNDTISVKLEDGTDVSPPSQQPRTNPATLPASRDYASEKIEIRKFDEDKWREIVESRNYTESRTRKPRQDQEPGQVDSDQRSGPRALHEDDEDRYDYDTEDSINLGWLGPLGQIIFYAAIAAIIVVILLQIVRNTSFKSNPVRTSASEHNADNIRDIAELDTEDLIQKAHNARDYKLAIRLYFLDLLKKLNENGKIAWTKDKTNRDYLSELFSKQYYFDEIRTLTLAYERVWYGEHIPTEEHYQELRSEFQVIKQKFTV
jgi:hypothetical protein